jgi:hypothetical protein
MWSAPKFLPDLKQIFIFKTYIHRSHEYEKFKENRDVEIALIHAETRISDERIDGQTDITKLTDNFSDYGNTPTNCALCTISLLTFSLCFLIKITSFPHKNYFIALYNENQWFSLWIFYTRYRPSLLFWVQSWSSLTEVFVTESGTEKGFYSRASVSPSNYFSINAPFSSLP